MFYLLSDNVAFFLQGVFYTTYRNTTFTHYNDNCIKKLGFYQMSAQLNLIFSNDVFYILPDNE